MENEIEKLISEYRQRIKQIEFQLEHTEHTITQSRRKNEDYSKCRLEQAKLNARLILCQQAKADFESLLDYV
tara:strand:- start:26417 stop:26632 length:216 start_codon:yes stop_codon:yes gene_type:complete